MRRPVWMILCSASMLNIAARVGGQMIDRDQLDQRPLNAEAVPSAASPIDSLEELRHAIHVMQTTWFDIGAGNWPTGIDWTRAVLDTHLTATAATFGRAIDHSRPQHQYCRQLENEINKYFGQNIAYYFNEDILALRHEAYDDILWVVLGWLESIRLINSRSSHFLDACDLQHTTSASVPWHGAQFIRTFARRADEFWLLASKGWDNYLCGGGMRWSPWLAPYKNAITNQLFISASAGMYLNFPGWNERSHGEDGSSDIQSNLRYLNAAIKGYDWLKNSGMTNRKGLYTDGFHISNWKIGRTKCDLRNEMVYTYNQGVLLSGLRDLWEGTGNQSYLEDGHELARNAIRATGWAFEGEVAAGPNEWAGLGRGGILEDRCDAGGNCNQDGQTFKGIFMHHLARLCEPLPRSPLVHGMTFGADDDLAFLHLQSCRTYAPWVAHNAKAALHTRDVGGRFGGWWGARRKALVMQLSDGAIDYRNNASELQQGLWNLYETNGDDPQDSFRDHAPSALAETVVNQPPLTTDLNDRGRGRTVETQSGGVAVLRALWELSRL